MFNSALVRLSLAIASAKFKMVGVKNIIDLARDMKIILRLIGGLAVRNHCAIIYFCEKEYLDVDFVGL